MSLTQDQIATLGSEGYLSEDFVSKYTKGMQGDLIELGNTLEQQLTERVGVKIQEFQNIIDEAKREGGDETLIQQMELQLNLLRNSTTTETDLLTEAEKYEQEVSRINALISKQQEIIDKHGGLYTQEDIDILEEYYKQLEAVYNAQIESG